MTNQYKWVYNNNKTADAKEDKITKWRSLFEFSMHKRFLYSCHFASIFEGGVYTYI